MATFEKQLFSDSYYGDVGTAASTLYVRKTGDDGSGDGSDGNPYKTIAKAISSSVDTRPYVTGSGQRQVIIVGPGEYNEVIDCRYPHDHSTANLRNRPIGNLTVRGESFMSATIIDAHTDPQTKYPSIVYGYTSGSIFENLVFRNVTGSGNPNSHSPYTVLNTHTRVINHPWAGGNGSTTYEGVGGSNFAHQLIRFLYCEHSQSKGGQANGVYIQIDNPTQIERWPARVDNCIFRGGGPAASAIENAGTALTIGNNTAKGASGSFATNNLIYYYANGIYTGGSYQAQIINNTILSCSHTGIETYRASKIYNNIVAGCSIQGSSEYGLVYNDDFDVEVQYNIITGNVSNLNALQDIRESSAGTTNSYPATNLRIDPQLTSTGSIDDRNNGTGESGIFGHEVGTFDFSPSGPSARCVDFGYINKLSSIGNSDLRGALRETEGNRKVDPIPTLVAIDAGAIELVYYHARGGPDGTSAEQISGDFTINTISSTKTDYNLPAIDNPAGDMTFIPFSVAVKGVPNIHPPTRGKSGEAYRPTVGKK